MFCIVDGVEKMLFLLSRTKDFTASNAALTARNLECTKNWEGTELQQLTYTNQRDIPYHLAPCSAIKAGVQNEEERDV